MEPPIEWCRDAQRGDRRAKERLSTWCLKRAFRLAYVCLATEPNRAALAEEIAGEAALGAIQYLDGYEMDRPFDPWLCQIVRNCIHKYYQRAQRSVPHAIYQRWVHDFLECYGPELQSLIQRELGQDASAPHPVLFQRIAADLTEKRYPEFVELYYPDRANAVLEVVKEWLRSYLGGEDVSFQDLSTIDDRAAEAYVAPDDTEAVVLEQDLVQRVNEYLTQLQPLCRRLLRWYFLDRLPVPEIARLEQMSRRTAYRRLENCAASLRSRLVRDEYFAEYAATGRPAALPGANPPGL